MHRARPETLIALRGQQGTAQYIDTLSWFDVVFAYRDHGSGPIL